MNRALPAAFAALVLLSACAAETGKPVPAPLEQTSGGSTPSSTPDEENGALTVDKPLDGRPFYGDPCKLLTPDQATALGLVPPGTSDLTLKSSPACDWQPPENRGQYSVNFTLNLEHGLRTQYQAQAELDKFELWEPTEVSGYPAVFADITDNRERGGCNVIVAINDEVTISARRQFAGGQDVCERVVAVAEQVLVTLKGA
ncbi:DUF3558 domain-containing protein [Actinokineospora bangkokensis]|uniref:DUF3558 domain-containing protein n=1 Tax=Actinokineospora bangkokensis TaxID=1193682 RepID=A0A1Q9LCP6_9PSEU|nr:DUF3558 domain-containing protein [Actinokineospora bangkokensis]OLR89789.1 hypothetical protein BJP25_01825 [Actinokineospora bangkokensis]